MDGLGRTAGALTLIGRLAKHTDKDGHTKEYPANKLTAKSHASVKVFIVSEVKVVSHNGEQIENRGDHCTEHDQCTSTVKVHSVSALSWNDEIVRPEAI